jgi:hypothetical protein
MQRLNTYTNNKNVINLGIDKDLMNKTNHIERNKNIDKNGFVDLSVFNSGDLIQKNKIISNKNAGNFNQEFHLTPIKNKNSDKISKKFISFISYNIN